MSRAIAIASWSDLMPPSEPGTTGMPSLRGGALGLDLVAHQADVLGRGPMKWMLCSARISAKRAFSERNP